MKVTAQSPDRVLPADTHIVYKTFSKEEAYDIYLKALKYVEIEPSDFGVPTSNIIGVTHEEWSEYGQGKVHAINSMLLHLIDNQFLEIELDAACDTFYYAWISPSDRQQAVV